MHPRYIAALQVIDAGFPVFPCIAPYAHEHVLDARGKCRVCATFKQPAVERGLHARTMDREQVGRWWSAQDYNLAFVPADAGLTVVDLDGALGSLSWSQLCTDLGINPGDPPMVRTPSGGLHLYYSGATFRPSAGKLGLGVDVRSEDSYALLPPSEVGGVEYTWIER